MLLTAGAAGAAPAQRAPAGGASERAATVPACSVAGLAPGAALPASERLSVSVTSGGVQRSFLLVLPEGYAAASGSPVLLAVHGALQNAAIFLNTSQPTPPGGALPFSARASVSL